MTIRRLGPRSTFLAALATVAVTLVVVVGAGRSDTPVTIPRTRAPKTQPPTSVVRAIAHAARRLGAPARAPARVCGNARELTGPRVPPRGAVRVRAGYDHLSPVIRPDRVYWFAPGIHTIGTSQYSQIQADTGDTFIGAPGAVLSGQHTNDFAFTSPAGRTGIKVEYLTIEDFVPPGSQGAISQSRDGFSGGGAGWTISHDTITDNSPGAGVILGSYSTLSNNCLSDNGEYGFQATSNGDASALTGGPQDVTVTGNEVTGNDTYNWESRNGGCGCSGGAKLWRVDGATITGNTFSDNRSVGLWVDTDNTGVEISGNYFSHNYAEGLIYETSYNAEITHNTFIDNVWGAGPKLGGFPDGAVYISESGGDHLVPGRLSGSFLISDNVLADNWSGVVLWESADRFCGSPDNSSTGTCTLTDPSVANINTCDQANLEGAVPVAARGRPDYFSLCRWKTQNVAVEHNWFLDWSSAIPGCAGKANFCGENGLFSQYGTEPPWSPYHGYVIEQAITFHRNNHFRDNTYVGSWHFVAVDQGQVVSLGVWEREFRQDLGST